MDEAMGFYVALDLLAPNTDLLEVYLALLTDQVGGYYDSTEKTMNTLLISGGELGMHYPCWNKPFMPMNLSMPSKTNTTI
ncbi:MAG UNVERIFIED_CONTAM: hypothetical protein LVT10_01045 [Anaerolineae bacterium]